MFGWLEHCVSDSCCVDVGVVPRPSNSDIILQLTYFLLLVSDQTAKMNYLFLKIPVVYSMIMYSLF